MNKKSSILFVSILILSNLSFAAAGWPRERELEHRKQALTPEQLQRFLTNKSSDTVKSIVLPAGLGYDQGSTGLCWFYATLNAIESSILAAEPNAQPAFSRNIMQSITHEDRYVRKILNIENNLEEGGTAVDAIDLLRGQGYAQNRKGLYHFADWTLQPHTYTYDPLQFSGSGTTPEMLNQLHIALNNKYGTAPATTHESNNQEISPMALQEKILGTKKWRAYGLENNQYTDGVEAAHFDVGYARYGTKSLYLNQQHLGEVIYKALSAGHGLTVTWRGHDEAVYGATFDQNNQPTLLFIKGSYSPSFLYTMEMKEVFNRAIGFSTVDVDL